MVFKNKIYVERDSVCLGDDCNAPNAKNLDYEDDERLSDFIDAVAKYVPTMREVVWSVSCKDETIAYLIFDENANYKYELSIQDVKVSDLVEKKLYCRYYYERKLLDFHTNPPTDLYPEYTTLFEKVKAHERRL